MKRILSYLFACFLWFLALSWIDTSRSFWDFTPMPEPPLFPRWGKKGAK